jgi:hypothetical protein
MAKRRRTGITMAKIRRTGITMAKRRQTGITMAKRRRTGITMAKRRETCNTMAKRRRTGNRGPSNEHSYHIWFQLAQWFHRRLKTDNTLFDTFGAVVSFVYFRSTKNLQNIIFLEDHPKNIPANFGSN